MQNKYVLLEILNGCEDVRKIKNKAASNKYIQHNKIGHHNLRVLSVNKKKISTYINY